MIKREKLLSILDKQIKNKNIVKHMLAVEACMRALAKKLGAENEDDWAVAGLVHDLDYRDDVPPQKHRLLVGGIL